MCWRCEKIEHQNKEYQATNKRKEKINMLDFEVEVKNKLCSILKETENNSSLDENISYDFCNNPLFRRPK